MTASLAPAAPPAPVQPLAWLWRLQAMASAYLPLLIMALLAAGTWWLVKSTPVSDDPGIAPPPKHEPDYQMKNFELQRFGPDGRRVLRVEGSEMRHYPDTDTLEIDGIRVHAFDAKGGMTIALARQAVTNGDASEMQLTGGVQVQSFEANAKGERPSKPTLEVRSEFLRALANVEKINSHLPAQISYAGGELKTQRFEYDGLSGKLTFSGRTTGVFAAPGAQRQKQ